MSKSPGWDVHSLRVITVHLYWRGLYNGLYTHSFSTTGYKPFGGSPQRSPELPTDPETLPVTLLNKIVSVFSLLKDHLFALHPNISHPSPPNTPSHRSSPYSSLPFSSEKEDPTPWLDTSL